MSQFVGLACDWGNAHGICPQKLVGADAAQLISRADREGWRLVGTKAYCDRHAA